jgi:uncharacterized DUF497 family protein
MTYEWDEAKRLHNLEKHGVDFADAVGVLEDEQALSQEDKRAISEERFVVVGMDYLGRVLTVAYTIRGENIRLISARKATKTESDAYGQ